MDVSFESESGYAQAAAYISHFSTEPSVFPWTKTVNEEIEMRRALLNDSLLFDVLLTLGGIKDPANLYPPSSPDGLDALLDAIGNSAYDKLKQECLVYFLLKWYQDGREAKFQTQVGILPQFSALAEAYWYLDSGYNIPRAVSLLSDIRLNRDYSSKIFHAISLSPADAAQLVVTYARTAKPPLVEPNDIYLYCVSLAEVNFFEAWQYQRTFGEQSEWREPLLRKLFEWTVTPSPRPEVLKQLLAFPFSPYEHGLLQNYVLSPPPSISLSSLGILQNLICVRMIQGGRYADAIKTDRLLCAESPIKDSGERGEMMRSLYDALSPTERSALDFELEGKVGRAGWAMGTKKGKAPTAGDISMDQSWVDVRPASSPPKSLLASTKTRALSSSRGPPITPISRKFGAPLSISQRGTGSPARIGQPSTQTVLLSSSISSGPSKAPSQNLGSSILGSHAALKATPLSSSIIGRAGPSFNLNTSTSSTATAQGTPLRFESSARKANAFYKPPTTNGTNVSNESPFVPTPLVLGRPSSDNVDDMDVEPSPLRDTAQESGLEFSLFGGRGAVGVEGLPFTTEQPYQNAPPPVQPVTSASTAVVGKSSGGISARAPPGAFDSEDDHTGDDEEVITHSRRTTRTNRRTTTKTTSSISATSSKTISGTRSKTISAPRQKSARGPSARTKTIPGGLMDDEDEEDDAEEEEEDDIAPLPSHRATKTRTAIKRTSSASDLDEGEGEGRRRSSRLSSITRDTSGESALRKTTRKSTAKTKTASKAK